MFAACNSNIPDEKRQLIGTWSEPYHVNIMVKSITFNEDGTLIYIDKPDTTWNTVVDDAGNSAKLNYSVKNDKLIITGYTRPYPSDDTKPFSFTSGYNIVENTLTIDSFSYDGGDRSSFYKPLKLIKK